MEKKKTILMLCDHPLAASGVGTQARWLINGLLKTGKYKFFVFGGAIKHANYDEQVVNPDFIIKPTNAFGDRNLLRQALAQLKPDAMLLFTDPRFFIWVWQMEDEIHQVCPITYNHLWDNPPWPEFNRVLYESTDLINCINWPTYEMVHERFPERTNYIPHAVPAEIFKPLPPEENEKFKVKLLGERKKDHFIGLYVSRNARRKLANDIINSWKIFLDELESKYGHRKATLVMHTEPFDNEGPNLQAVTNLFGLQDHVVFTRDRIEFEEMSSLYNICDVLVNRSCNEGFGLGVLEAKMCGKPVIAIKTGGLTRQVEDHETGFQYGVALEPEVRCLAGSQSVPYIYEDFVSHKSVSDAFMKMYDLGPDGRRELGLKAAEHARKNYGMEDVIKNWDKTLTNCIENWKSTYKRWEITEL